MAEGGAQRSGRLAGLGVEETKREIRTTLFPGVFRDAELKGRVDAADREMWRAVFLDDPEAFDFATAFDFLDADGGQGSRQRRGSYLAKTLRGRHC
jgi:hypothetical protein